MDYNSIQYVNIFPNVWVFYLNGNVSNANNVSVNLKKFCDTNKIKKIIRIDKDVKYWNKSENYIDAIKKQLMQDEIKKLTSYYKKKNFEIKRNYYDNETVLIISNNQLEIVIGMFIIFLKDYADMELKSILLSLQSKFNTKITLSDNMKALIHSYS